MSQDVREFLERMADEVGWKEEVPPRMLRRARWRRARTMGAGLLTMAIVSYTAFAAVRSIQGSVRPARSGECSWMRVESPNADPGRFANRLVAVAVVSDDDIWAVGDRYEPEEGGEVRPLAMHWDGVDWTIMPLPPELSGASLADVAATSPDEVWAVGVRYEGGEGPEALALRWDGQDWTEVPIEDPAARFHDLRGLAAVSRTEVWAVGGMATATSGSSLVQRWDGKRWSMVETAETQPMPLTALPYAGLEAVHVISPADAWSVGYVANVAPAGPSNTLIKHWDGERWSVVPSPDVRADDGLPYDILFSVSAASPEDVWAVGSFASEPGYGGGDDRALIEHWDGDAWTVSRMPEFADASRLSGVAAASSDEAWAVGSTGSFVPLVLRWDGRAWDVAPVSVGSGALADVAISPGNDLWAVGNLDDGLGRSSTLVLRCQHGSD